MGTNNTLFMTAEESERVRKTVQDHMQKCQDQSSQLRKSTDPDSLIQQATSASLMQDLSLAAFGLKPVKKSRETMVAYAVGRPYLPSTAKLEDLEPMEISDLRMETHHLGRSLLLRRVSPVVELEASSWAVVQGELPEEVERIEVFLHKSQHDRDILDVCSELFVKEPFYTLSSQGQPTIRIDHPSDIVVSASSDDPEAWRQRRRMKLIHTVKSPKQCKEEGNIALQKKDYHRAHTSYTDGIKSMSENQQATSSLGKDIYRNRAHVNLLLKRFDEAKADALSSLTTGESEEQESLNAKAYYRAGLAAYALGDFLDAKRHFLAQQGLQPDNQYAKLNLRRIELRLQEEATGSYNFKKIVSGLSKTHGRSDAANFNGYTEIKESRGAGRGLFATHDIQLNDIILCEKAFCVVWGYEAEAFSALTCDVRDDTSIRVFPAGLHKAVVQKLLNNPSQVDKVLGLYSDYAGLGNTLLERDGRPIIDTFQVHDIIQRNAFGPGQQTGDEDISNASTGLWIRASYINHSCVPNAKKDFVGDLMIFRANRKIYAGEEITQAYDESSDYDTRATLIRKTWDFKCQCALCVAEEADGPALRKTRQDLEEKANTFAQTEKATGATKLLVNKAKRLRQGLNDSYDKRRYEGLPRRALAGIDAWLKEATLI
ncbi:TPR domain-containing protein [Mariannaea sp. PMI_226]|nr:TPR domain-containing protein [Mariannaea sp. PMI_226]